MPSVAMAAGHQAADWRVIKQLSNLNDINRLLHETVAAERAIDVDLDKQLDKRDAFERSLLMLNASTADMLELVRADSEQLVSGVAATAHAAQRIGSRIRHLDHVYSNMQGALDLTQLILDRTSCVTGVQSAMAAGDYDQAAGYISRFLELEQQLSAAVQGADTGQVEEQRQLLLSAQAQLETVVSRKLEEAIAARHHNDVLRYVLLHKPLGAAAQGVSRYIGSLAVSLGTKGRELYEALDQALEQAGGAAHAAAARGKQPSADFVSALMGLFKAVAVAVEQDEEVITAAFGPGALLDVVVGAQAECDRQGVRLVARYLEFNRVPQLVAEAQSSKRSTPPVAGGAKGRLEPRKVEPLVQEMVVLLQRADEYSCFMLGKMQDCIAAAKAAAAAATPAAADAAKGPRKRTPRLTGADPGRISTAGGLELPVDPAVLALERQLATAEDKYRSGQLCVAIRELVAQYVALEEYYMEESAHLAIHLDQLIPGALTTSMVDDVFFILKKSGARALASSSVQSACALLGLLNDVLANHYKAALAGRLAGGAARLVAAAPAILGLPEPAAGASSGAQEHAVAINNVAVSAEYVSKLQQELDSYADRAFASSVDRERVASVLTDLTKTGSDFRVMSNRALEGVGEALLARLRPVFDEVGGTSYQIEEADYAAGDMEVGWVVHLVAAMDSQLKWLQELLTPHAWEALFQLVLDKVLARLEALLGRKAFTQLGGLQLDRDLRALIAAVGELASGTVRDKFARLNQMAIVLSLESVEEFLDYWGEDTGHVTWRLTPAEVRSILKQRADFSKDAIASLPL